MISPTYGKVDLRRTAEIIYEFYQKNLQYEAPLEITIGTDSQNFDDTKIVEVIAARVFGHCGIYFYNVTRLERITDIRLKLNTETAMSLALANSLISEFEEDEKLSEMFMKSRFAIHVDAGNSDDGKTKDLIPGIVGWVKASGYDCVVKPESFAASCVADRISK